MGLNEEIWPGERVRHDLNLIMWSLFNPGTWLGCRTYWTFGCCWCSEDPV